jgi:tRNA(fMet)-specific endonuclease VapC
MSKLVSAQQAVARIPNDATLATAGFVGIGFPLAGQVNLILSAIEILPLESPADREYARLRQYLARRGTLIGPNDMLIAAQALGEGLTVVTANTREFARVPGLSVENWLTE